MTPVRSPMDEWKNVPWKQIERNVFKLQKRIYRASEQNDRKKVHRLQRLLMKSRAGRLLAVRKVTQDNSGKKTAGIDGQKSLTPKQRMVLSQSLRVQDKASPLRRVEIPKPGTTETRKLGIPTIADRATQTLVTGRITLSAKSIGWRPICLLPRTPSKFGKQNYGDFESVHSSWRRRVRLATIVIAPRCSAIGLVTMPLPGVPARIRPPVSLPVGHVAIVVGRGLWDVDGGSSIVIEGAAAIIVVDDVAIVILWLIAVDDRWLSNITAGAQRPRKQQASDENFTKILVEHHATS